MFGKVRGRKRECIFTVLNKRLFMPNTLAELFQSNSSTRKYDPCVTAKVRETYGDLQSKFRSPKLNLPRGWLSSRTTFFPRLIKANIFYRWRQGWNCGQLSPWSQGLLLFRSPFQVAPFISFPFFSFPGIYRMLRKVCLFLYEATDAYKTFLDICMDRKDTGTLLVFDPVQRWLLRVCGVSLHITHPESWGEKDGVHSRNMFLVSLSWEHHLNRIFGSYEGEAGDFVGTARLPQEETDGVVSWAGESPLPSLVGGRGETRSSALSTRMQLFHQKSEIILPGGLYLPWGSWCLWFQPARTWGFL